jgi:predicted aspartyl protease
MVRGTTCLLAAVASALVSTTPLRSAEAIADVPFELYQHHLVVAKGAIGQLSNLSLLIDTGTIPSAVDQRIARKLRLQTESSALIAFGQQVPVQGAMLVDGFRIGSLRTGPVPVHVSDLSYLDGVHIDAIVGLDVLSRTSFSIDYQARALRLAPAAPEDAVTPMEIAWPFVTVQMTIGGAPVRLLVDTGSSDLVLFQARMPATLSHAAWRGDKIVQYASGPARLLRLELREASLGSHVWDKLAAWGLDRSVDGYPPNVDGVLGVMALGCRSVRFDFERGEFGWSR